MGLDDRGAIDSALDAAEAKMAEPSIPQEEVIQESPSEPAEGTPDLVADAEVARQLEKGRDEQGKFAKGKKSHWKPRTTAPETPQEPVSDQRAEPANEGTQPEEPAQASTSVNEFWPAELKEAAAKSTDRALVEKFNQHYSELQRNVDRFARESQKSREVANKLYEGWDNYKDQAKENGIEDPIQELHRYRKWDAGFQNNPLPFIRKLVQSNPQLLTPETIFGGAPVEQYQSQIDPRYQELEAKFQAVERQLEEQRNQVKAQHQAALESELNAFKQGKDSAGEVRAANMARFEPQIAAVIPLLREQYPQFSRNELLHHAYECVMQDIRAAYAPAPRDRGALIANARKAQNAASSVTGSPSIGVFQSKARLKGKSFNEKLSSAMDNAEERISSR